MENKELKEKYREVFEDIKASQDLKKKILEMKPKKRNYRPAIAIASTVAAAIAVFAVVGEFDFTKRDNSGIIEEETAVSKAVETQLPKPPVSEEMPTAPTEGERRERAFPERPAEAGEVPSGEGQRAIPADASEMRRNMPQNAGQIDRSKMPERRADFQRPSASAGMGEKVPEKKEETSGMSPQQQVLTETARSTAMSQSRESQPVSEDGANARSRKNDAQPVSEPTAESKERTSGDERSNLLKMEEWNNERYFSYLGVDIVKKIEEGNRFSYVGADSNFVTIDAEGMVFNDEWSFAFENPEGGYINIITSKKSLPDIESIDKENSSVKSIKGINAVFFEDVDSFTCYIQINSVSYVIYASSVTMEEFTEMVSLLI